jgi:hypothetical protein
VKCVHSAGATQEEQLKNNHGPALIKTGAPSVLSLDVHIAETKSCAANWALLQSMQLQNEETRIFTALIETLR